MSLKTIFQERATEIVVASVFTGVTAIVASNIDMKSDFKDLKFEFNELREVVIDLQDNSYNTEYKEVLYELADSATHEQIIADITYWKEDNKGGKLGSMDTLCREPERKHLLNIMREKTAIDACRIVGAAG